MLLRLLSLFLVLGLSVSAAAAPKVPEIEATSFYLLDAHTGKVLAKKKETEQLEPASITKIMTAYILFSYLKDNKIKLDDMVDISEEASQKGGSKMFIKAGTQVSLKDLLRGMIVSPGNDASIALAEHIAGSEEAFADLMNEYAARLGMHDSYFVNATGWPHEAHYSTAKDIAAMSLSLISNFPEFYKIFAEKSFTYGKSPQGKDITQPNRNSLLWKKGFKADGIKTGHTEAAGYCLAASATRGDMRLLSVVMGTKSKKARTKNSQSLLNFGFRHFQSKKLFAKNETASTVRVYKGEKPELSAGSDKDLFATVEKVKIKNVRVEIEIDEPLSAPIVKGQKIGKIKALVDDEIIAEYPLQALEEIQAGGIFIRLWDSLRLLTGL